MCETQLRGADTDHWEALLDYFETAAAGTAIAPPVLHEGASVNGVGCVRICSPEASEGCGEERQLDGTKW